MTTLQKSRLNVVSIFTGAGGLDIGLEQAGFETKKAVELMSDYCGTLRVNQDAHIKIDGDHNRSYFENCDIINEDISDINPKKLKLDEDIDCLAGGPPCQAFSSAGKQQSIFDERGALVYEYFRILKALRPKTFLFENVRGLVTARGRKAEPGEILDELLKLFNEAGYNCRVSLLNAADYGAWQRRVRCFILGSRIAAAPAFPIPEYAEEPCMSLVPSLCRKKWRTLGEFLALHADKDSSNWTLPTPALEAQLKDIPSGKGLRSAGRVETTRPGGHWGYRQGTFIADPDKPARTVTGGSSQDWIRLEDGTLRRLTLKEVAALQGFPEEWQFCGSKNAQFQQVGNAVPTVFGRVLGKTLADYLTGGWKRLPSENATRLPRSIKAAIQYTKRDSARNGACRANLFPLQINS